MEQWSILSNIVNYVQYDRNPKTFHVQYDTIQAPCVAIILKKMHTISLNLSVLIWKYLLEKC